MTDFTQEEFLALRDPIEPLFWRNRLKVWLKNCRQNVIFWHSKNKKVVIYRGEYHWEVVTRFEVKRNKLILNDTTEISLNFKTADEILVIFETLTIHISVWRELYPPHKVSLGER